VIHFGSPFANDLGVGNNRPGALPLGADSATAASRLGLAPASCNDPPNCQEEDDPAQRLEGESRSFIGDPNRPRANPRGCPERLQQENPIYLASRRRTFYSNTHPTIIMLVLGSRRAGCTKRQFISRADLQSMAMLTQKTPRASQSMPLATDAAIGKSSPCLDKGLNS